MLKDKAALATLVIFLCGYAVLGLTGVASTAHLLNSLIAGYLLAWGLYVFLSDLPRTEVRARFVLMTLVGVAILGAAELLGVLGVINYQTLLGTEGRTWFDRPGYVRDPELGYRHEAHYREKGSLSGAISVKRSVFRPIHPKSSTFARTNMDFGTTTIWIGRRSW